MARVKNIANPWGKQGGPNPQRTDLWQVDLSEVVKGVNEAIRTSTRSAYFPALPDVPPFFIASVSFPEQKMRAEAIRRDSRSYNMPSWDEPLEAFRFTFIFDSGNKDSSDTISQSMLYTVMDIWRTLVRAGRGAVGSEENIQLNSNYRIDFSWPIVIRLLRGTTVPATLSTSQTTTATTVNADADATWDGSPISQSQETITQTRSFAQYASESGTLDVSQEIVLEQAWLAGFKLGDLNYQAAGILTLDATVYAANIYPTRRSDMVPSYL